MHLAPASFDPYFIKRDISPYCKGLIASIKNNHALIEQSFSQCAHKRQTLSITLCNLEISPIGKDTSRKNYLQTY